MFLALNNKCAMWIKCNCLICCVLCIKTATGDTGQEMEAAVMTGSSGETLTGAAMQLYTIEYMLTELLYGN